MFLKILLIISLSSFRVTVTLTQKMNIIVVDEDEVPEKSNRQKVEYNFRLYTAFVAVRVRGLRTLPLFAYYHDMRFGPIELF